MKICFLTIKNNNNNNFHENFYGLLGFIFLLSEMTSADICTAKAENFECFQDKLYSMDCF